MTRRQLAATAACGGGPRSVADRERAARCLKYFDCCSDLLLRSLIVHSINGVSIVRAQPTSCLIYSIAAALSMTAAAANAAHVDQRRGEHAVFAMTNDAESNEVKVFERGPTGSLQEVRSYTTGGRGSGGTIDPLESQGSLTLSQDRNWLFAANAGSGTLSVFH